MSEDQKSPKSPLTGPTASVALIKDACPAWADRLIREMLALEIRMGNIQPHEDEGDEWHSDELERLQQRLEARESAGGIDEATTENLFKQVVVGLSHEGFAVSEIAAMVNARMVGKSRLPYCSSDEVKEALS